MMITNKHELEILDEALDHYINGHLIHLQLEAWRIENEADGSIGHESKEASGVVHVTRELSQSLQQRINAEIDAMEAERRERIDDALQVLDAMTAASGGDER